jgi:hypothetical protein
MIAYGVAAVGVAFMVAGLLSDRRGPIFFVMGAALLAVGLWTLVVVERQSNSNMGFDLH